MQFLIDFAAEDKPFQELVARASEFRTVQGVVLDIDRTWLRAWLRSQGWAGRQAGAPMDSWLRWLGGVLPPGRPAELPGGPQVFFRPLEFGDVAGWRPSGWGQGGSVDGDGERRWPLVAKVCLRPAAGPDERTPALEALRPEGAVFRTEIETRSRAQLASNPRKAYSPLTGGVSIGIGAKDYGTLGVVLTDEAGDRHALTCAHVAPTSSWVNQPSQRDLASAGVVGQSIWSTALVECPAGQCNPWSGHTPNDVDISLIALNAMHPQPLLEVLDVGPLSGVLNRAQLSTSQSVEVMGRTSGYNALQIGALAAWYNLTFDGKDYCFRNLFEVESPYGVAGVIKLGDSGAPVCADGATGPAWAGMVIGRDAFKGYALYSQTIMDTLSANGYVLTVQ